jgi:secreted protein with Ig-like and vWFA domain
VDPLQSLTDTSRKQSATDAAPAAAAWLQNPAAITKRKTWAQRILEDLEQNGEWTGPAYGTPENPAHE